MSSPKTASRHHLALHATQLGIQRWRLEAAGAAPSSMPQADWHAAAQQRFMDWLAAGGVKQQECINENSGNDAAVLMSRCGTQCEELKFSLIHINDAVE